MQTPKCYLLYFKSLLDVAFIEFFRKFNDCFAKNDNGQYVLMRALDENAIQSFFIKSIEAQLDSIVVPYDAVNAPNTYFIIGACNPRDNFLLNFREDKYFPKKLDDMIFKNEFQLKYILKEKDIKIDIVKFNQACIDAFNHFFCTTADSMKQSSNRIFISHKNLDCYSMFKALKFILGKSNCINLHKEKFNEISPPIVAINDLIDSYVHNKHAANSNIKFKKIINELRQFISFTTKISL